MSQFQYVDPNIYDNRHKGSSGFVIGGGHSIRSHLKDGFEFTSLKGKITIGVNKAYDLLLPDYLIFTDTYFWSRFKDEVSVLDCIKFVPDDLARAHKIGELGNQHKFHVVRREPGSYGASKMAPETFGSEVSFWNNTGVAALRVAAIMGLNPIYLIGIDVIRQDENGNTHFHDAYGANRTNRGDEVEGPKYETFYTAFKVTIIPMLERGIKIYSCSPVSKLNDLIPFKDIKGVL